LLYSALLPQARQDAPQAHAVHTKLCGIRSVGDAAAAVRAGADMIGVIMVEGARRKV
jgi:glutamate synthase domain-containing protein 2